VNFDDKIRQRELQLVGPQPAGLGLRGKPVPRPDELQNVGGLADQKPPALRNGVRTAASERGRPAAASWRHSGSLTGPAGHIDIGRAALLQRQSHKFAAALNLRPIVKLVDHRMLLEATRWRRPRLHHITPPRWRGVETARCAGARLVRFRGAA